MILLKANSNQYLLFRSTWLWLILLSKKGKSFPFSTVFATARKETLISSSFSVLNAATHTFLMSHDCMILKGNHMQTVELFHQKLLKRYVIQQMLLLFSSLHYPKDLRKSALEGGQLFVLIIRKSLRTT